MKKCLFLIALTFVFFSASANALELFTVRAIYFQPLDSPDKTDEIREVMRDVHEFYASEMIRYGYGIKTFRTEKDENNEIRVHIINGKHNAEHYADADKTYLAIKPELPIGFTDKRYANIIFVGGLTLINKSLSGIAVASFGGGVNGGYAVLAANDFRFDVVVHEIGHTFGLSHNTHRDDPDRVMGINAGIDGFAHYEARWLDKSFYFNPNPSFNVLPTIIKVHPLIRTHNDIQFKMDIESPNGVYQAEIARASDSVVIATHYLTGQQNITAQFDFPLRELAGNKSVYLRVMDTRGIFREKGVDIQIPAWINKNPDLLAETDKKEDVIPEPKPTPEPEKPRIVLTRTHFTTSWANMKKRR